MHLSIPHQYFHCKAKGTEKEKERGRREGEGKKKRKGKRGGGGEDSTPEAQKVGPERGEHSIPARGQAQRRSELLLRGNLSSGTASFEWSSPNNSVTWFGHHAWFGHHGIQVL